jgi:hypothetical protein
MKGGLSSRFMAKPWQIRDLCYFYSRMTSFAGGTPLGGHSTPISRDAFPKYGAFRTPLAVSAIKPGLANGHDKDRDMSYG